MRERILAGLLFLCLCLPGCGEESDGKIFGSKVWTEGLPLTWGQLEGEKLTPLPWDSGRAEATSRFAIAETRDGYYMCNENQLVYADKTNLDFWVPVCNQPNCSHSTTSWSYGQVRCNAWNLFKDFHIQDDRIWTVQMITGTALSEDGEMYALVSMNPDGSDKRVEQTDRELIRALTFPAVYTSKLLPGQWLCNIEDLQPDGSMVVHCYRYDGNSWEEYFQAPNETGNKGLTIGLTLPRFICGDTAIQHDAISAREGDCIRFLEEGYEIINLPSETGYLSGDIFRYYKQNDGYYDFNIRTREAVRLADIRIENGFAQLVLPNCIVESTLLTDRSLDTRTPEMLHTLVVFDGQQWRPVTLPAELQSNDHTFLLLQAVTSDSILFASCKRTASGASDVSGLYRIDLTRDTWELDYVAQIRPGG